jgi:anthranilate 1,2-dioxygenase (deaminating, decarboxylating) large subunit
MPAANKEPAMKLMRHVVLLSLSTALLCAVTARSYDLPTVNLGLTSFFDGGPPAGPGFYFTQYFEYYHANKFATDGGNTSLLPNGAKPTIEVFVGLSQLVYQSDQKILLGGKWGVDFILPAVDYDVEPKSPWLTDNGAGIGDILIGPFLQWDPIMGEKGPIFMHRVEFQCILPTGSYSPNDDLNAGANFFSFNPYWAATWFVVPKWSLSWRVHYLWNDENDSPDRNVPAFAGARKTQAGQAVHLNWATEYEVIEKRLHVGVNSYFLTQFTDTKVDGAEVAGRREQVLGVGPGAVYHFSKEDHLFLNTYFEMDARNRAEGQRFVLRFVHHF